MSSDGVDVPGALRVDAIQTRGFRGTTVAGQVEAQDIPMRPQGFGLKPYDEIVEHAQVQGPAMQHDQWRSAHPQALSRAASKPSTCSGVCAAESVMRSRDVPAGTVGGRIAVTR